VENTKQCSTPTVVGKSLTADDGEVLKNPTYYRCIIGALKYLTRDVKGIGYGRGFQYYLRPH